MSDAVIVALITAGAAVLSNWLIARSNREKDAAAARKDAEARGKDEQELRDRLKSIEQKVDEHNGYAKRFEEIAVALGEIMTELKHINRAA